MILEAEVGMLNVETIAKIRRAFFSIGKSGAIAGVVSSFDPSIGLAAPATFFCCDTCSAAAIAFALGIDPLLGSLILPPRPYCSGIWTLRFVLPIVRSNGLAHRLRDSELQRDDG
jgi:hypothetical protein